MILFHDTINQVPYSESTTCEFHKRNPGKSFAGCCCSFATGWRKATPEERRANIAKAQQEARERIDELTAEIARLDALKEQPPC